MGPRDFVLQALLDEKLLPVPVVSLVLLIAVSLVLLRITGFRQSQLLRGGR